jgi:uncharacterized OB-fold protein
MEAPRHWRTQTPRYRLIGIRCQSCGSLAFPPRDLCPDCLGGDTRPYQFSGRGAVYSYSTVFQGPDGFADYIPYWVALVKLEEGPLVAAQLADVDKDQVSIGMPVEMVTRRLREDGPRGIVLYGYKFRPVLAGQPEGQGKSSG